MNPNSAVTPDDALVVVLLGLGVVFIGLICLILVCKLMAGLVQRGKKKETPVAKTAPVPVTSAPVAEIQNRGELVAAISVALAEELGQDVTDLRILSITKR